MTPSTVSAVLFDLDGTLIDTAPEFIHIGLQLRAEAGFPPIDAKTIWHSVSNGAIGMVEAALEMPADDPAFEQWRQRFLTLYEASLGDLSHPYPGLPELVAGLDKAGRAWGVVTNKLSRFALPLMNKMPFDPAAGAVVTPDHVDQPKPDPEAILLACEQLSCDPTETLFIGDHLRDIEAGRGAGCFTLAAAYGYLAPGEAASSWQADAVAESSRGLAEMILGMLS